MKPEDIYQPSIGDTVSIETGGLSTVGEVVELVGNASTVGVRVTEDAHPAYGQKLYVNLAQIQRVTFRRGSD